MSASRGLTRSWSVGSRTVTLTMQRPEPGSVLHATMEWSPDQPSRLSTEEWAAYRQGRRIAMESVAQELGITVAVLEA